MAGLVITKRIPDWMSEKVARRLWLAGELGTDTLMFEVVSDRTTVTVVDAERMAEQNCDKSWPDDRKSRFRDMLLRGLLDIEEAFNDAVAEIVDGAIERSATHQPDETG